MSSGLSNSKDLHLPDLTIKGFRGIERLSVPRLGRVNLFVGKNGTGKTTLLDAVRVYASRASLSVLSEILHRSDEFTSYDDEDGEVVFSPDWLALTYGRNMPAASKITIGPKDKLGQIQIMLSFQRSLLEEHYDEDASLFTVSVGKRSRELPLSYLRRGRANRLLRDDPEFPSSIPCNSLGPGRPTNSEIALFWDRVVLTDDERRAEDALNLLLGIKVERVAMVGDPRSRGRGQRAVIKIQDKSQPVPLRSLGDGTTRLFGVALALANSKDGFLLIDEAENGIHHSIQSDFWKMVIKTADANNVQVFATTHSWDCFTGFALAAAGLGDEDVSLSRIERVGDQFRLMTYPVEDLEIAAQQGIEVR